MCKRGLYIFTLSAILLCAGSVGAVDWVEMNHSDSLEIVFSDLADTTFVWRNVVFQTESGMIYCDSAVWAEGASVKLMGSVIVDEADYRLAADSYVFYDLSSGRMEARGSYVELWSRPDSIMAVGRQASYDRERKYFYMLDRPTILVNYPDSASMVEIIGDVVEYDALTKDAQAYGNVRISSPDISATAGCAVMHAETDVLDLSEDPVLYRGESQVTGKFVTVTTENKRIRRVEVIDSANAEFNEPTDDTELFFDQSILSGRHLVLDFPYGVLSSVACWGQAYSWYFPSPKGKSEETQNAVSGDSIHFSIADDRLTRVDVIGGAAGRFLDTKLSRVPVDSLTDDSGATVAQILSDTEKETTPVADSAAILDSLLTLPDSLRTSPRMISTTDTIDYAAHHIRYGLSDSLITLSKGAHTVSGTVVLDAHLIELDTRSRVIEAYSAAPVEAGGDSAETFASLLQPNAIPVLLQDRDQTMQGDYLRYSLDTKKGRIVTSKSKYETGFFYGSNLYRQTDEVFYLEGGDYTTCDYDEPHFHFHSSHLKLINGKRLVAKPVIMYLGRLPIFAIPYYVFPLDRGRRSGILPFSLGNFERGERQIENLGYYWVASEYWDWQGSLSYYELNSTVNFRTEVRYNKLYAFNGSLRGEYARETGYSSSSGTESKKTRWFFRGSHSHEFSPTFKLSASGQIQSDKSYFTDFSTDLNQRLNRNVTSQIDFTKRFGRSVTVSGKVRHDENLDTETRTDYLPDLGISLPTISPFGAGKLNDEGRLESKWYNQLRVSYRPRMTNYSTRKTNFAVDSLLDTTITYDTTWTTVVDTLTGETDSTVTAIDTSLVEDWIPSDTIKTRSRKKYTRVDHTVVANLPLTIAKYFNFNPSFTYQENWFNIYRTDQSDTAGLDPTTYRTYMYTTGASLSTKLYGTVYPNVFGLVGLRQVLTPTVSYDFTPESNRHPEVNAYAGGSARSTSRSQRIGVSLSQVYQAKVRKEAGERNLELATFTSNFSYDFEKDSLQFSDLNTAIRSNVLPRVTINGSMRHSLYKKGTSDLDFWNPRLLDFDASASLTMSGSNFLFDDPGQKMPRGADSASQVPGQPGSSGFGGSGGWTLSLSYTIDQSGFGTNNFRRRSFLNLNLGFNLTPTTRITYRTSYDPIAKKSSNTEIRIDRMLHCWQGSFNWVPVGSNRGWGFRLNVLAIPALKIDNNQSSLRSSYFTESF